MPLTFTPHQPTPNIHSTDQSISPDFKHKVTFSEAKDLDLPITKRRKLNEDHFSIACEAYTLPQQHQCWSRQIYLPLEQNDRGGHYQSYLTQLKPDHNQQHPASLAQQDNDRNRQYPAGLSPHGRNVDQPLQQHDVELDSQYHLEPQLYSKNTIDTQGWDLTRLHQGLQVVQHSNCKEPSPIARYQITFSQDDLVAQNALHYPSQEFDNGNFYLMRDVLKTSYSYNSWNGTQYQNSLQIEPGKELEGAKTSDLDVSNLESSIEYPLQSTQELQCSVYSILHSWKSQPSGQGSGVQEDIAQKSPQSQELQGVQENGLPVTSAVSQVCYGMLVDIQPCDTVSPQNTLDQPRALVWNGKLALHDPEMNSYRFQLQERTFRMLKVLSDDATVNFQFMLQGKPEKEKQAPIASKHRIASLQILQDQRLSIILYGPAGMAEAVGSWLNKCQIYLQMPENCDRNVPYSNPHCLSFNDEDTAMTFELASRRLCADSAELHDSMNILTELENQEPLAEAPQPFLIATALHKYQKQGLTFMVNREKGWDLGGSRTDVWRSYADQHGTLRYQNTLSGQSQLEPPPEFKGGCLADCMGLGKTLSMLSLVAANPFSTKALKSCGEGLFQESIKLVKATLIILPFSLLQEWEKQIQRHFRQSSVEFLVYYGRGREKHYQSVGKYDIVLTTYNTVTQDWKLQKSQRQKENATGLFSIYWHRIILDEAHMIRSERTISARSIFSLTAEHRWCITGTPIQNRLSDLRSLLRFLKVHPYDDPKVFEAEISQPWKTIMDKTALEKLQSLIKIVALRRSRAVISLPERHDILHDVLFSPEERIVYERAKLGTIDIIDLALDSVPLLDKPAVSAYIRAFQKINDLRYICNHGILPKRVKRSNNNHDDMQGPGSFYEQLDKLFNAANSACLDCGIDIQEVDERSDQLLTASCPVDFDTDLQVCQDCQERRKACNYPSPKSSECSDMDDSNSVSSGELGLSSKVKALVSCLLQVPRGDKCVVFSYWTSTLDLVEQALNKVSITYCRYDGRLSRGNRSSVLETFANDAMKKVILVSITCGGQGLDLTVANHAFLVEPQWNPMLEEQAMSRVHRLGQTKAVHLVRFIVKNTWEEKVVTSQERKRTLASMIMEGRRLDSGNDGRKQLLHLRALVD